MGLRFEGLQPGAPRGLPCVTSRRLSVIAPRRRRIWPIALLLSIAVVILGFNWQLIATQVRWGLPVAAENFSDESWRERWGVRVGDWKIYDEALTSTGDLASYLVLRRRLVAPVAIEYDARRNQ